MRELLNAIEQVKGRIRQHEAQLRANEMLTRYALIDPILRALGWDTEDPEQVVPELSTPQGRPDYGLLWEGKTLVMVEAKPLGSDMDKARREGFRYCWENRVPYFMVTNGDVWELHDLSEMGGKQIFRVQLSQDNPGDVARQLLALWRPAMPEVAPAPAPLMQEPKEDALPKKSPTPDIGIPLSELRKMPTKGEKVSGRLRFPDGKEVPINRWRDILVEVAKWALPKLELPVRGRHGGLLMDSKPNDWREPKQIGSNAWVETSLDAHVCVKRACYILEKAGVNPEEVVLIRKQTTR